MDSQKAVGNSVEEVEVMADSLGLVLGTADVQGHVLL